MIEKEGKQHVVLCEGFDDRSFWSGWLQHLGCTDPTDRGKKLANDAWGRPVKGGGRYLFFTPAGSRVLVHPFQGSDNARKAAGEYLQGQVYRPDRMVLNLDSDVQRGGKGKPRGAWPEVAVAPEGLVLVEEPPSRSSSPTEGGRNPGICVLG